MALKKRTVVSPAADAVSLPSLMADLPGTRRLEEVPLDKLSPAPADWNFYAPLPDDKLLELIESIRANDLLHPIVVWKQPDGALPSQRVIVLFHLLLKPKHIINLPDSSVF